MPLPFQRPFGLWALAAAAIFLILYLRRPKPQDKVIPSLMFIVQENKKSTKYSFLQKLMTNLLFLIQLLSILGLALVAAAPFVKMKYDVTLENTVVILDVSASMNAKEGGASRFEKAIGLAKGSLSGRNSIVLAENTPLIALENERGEIAKDILSKVKPKATSTNIGDSLLLAKDILGDKPGRIVVFSDFISTEGPDVAVVKAALSSENHVVDFVDVSNEAKNTGIVKMEISKYNTKVYIRNFNEDSQERKIRLMKDGKEITSTAVTIAPRSIENFEFDTPYGVSSIELEPKDSLETDDIAYLATPSKTKISVLLITNLKGTNLETALGSAKDIELNVVNPPVLTINTNKAKIDPYKHDLIIVYGINNVNRKDGIVPGTFDEIKDYVENGGNLIIAAQNGLEEIDMRGLPVFEVKNKVNKPTKACVDTINQITRYFEKDRCFTATGSYFSGELKKGAISLASATDKTPLIAYAERQKGKIAYYGIFDETSDFSSLPSYPIFWNSLINFMAGTEDIKGYNHKTGKIATISEQRAKTPSSTVTTSKLLMDEVGIYEYDNKRFAVNLLDEKESDVGVKTDIGANIEREKLLGREAKEQDFNLEFPILVIVFMLLMFEYIYIKRRGDF
jgi:hypothetical protein